jgi:hypothetical protein
MRPFLIILCFSMGALFEGCQSGSSKDIPLPVFSGSDLVISGSGNHTDLSTIDGNGVYNDIRDYITKYGDSGWIVGLRDKRNYSDATRPGAETGVRPSAYAHRNPFRVCDAFMIYYGIFHHDAEKDIFAYGWGLSSPTQRDREIEHLIEYIRAKDNQKRSEPPSQNQ